MAVVVQCHLHFLGRTTKTVKILKTLRTGRKYTKFLIALTCGIVVETMSPGLKKMLNNLLNYCYCKVQFERKQCI